MTKPLEYLDLQIKHIQSKISPDHFKYYCSAEDKTRKRRFHSDDQSVKFIV